MPATKHMVSGQDIRKSYYTMGDGLVGLLWAIEKEPTAKTDKELLRLLKNVQDAKNAFLRYLDANYLWD